MLEIVSGSTRHSLSLLKVSYSFTIYESLSVIVHRVAKVSFGPNFFHLADFFNGWMSGYKASFRGYINGYIAFFNGYNLQPDVTVWRPPMRKESVWSVIHDFFFLNSPCKKFISAWIRKGLCANFFEVRKYFPCIRKLTTYGLDVKTSASIGIASIHVTLTQGRSELLGNRGNCSIKKSGLFFGSLNSSELVCITWYNF